MSLLPFRLGFWPCCSCTFHIWHQRRFLRCTVVLVFKPFLQPRLSLLYQNWKFIISPTRQHVELWPSESPRSEILSIWVLSQRFLSPFWKHPRPRNLSFAQPHHPSVHFSSSSSPLRPFCQLWLIFRICLFFDDASCFNYIFFVN